MNNCESLESAALRYSARGMDRLRSFLPEDAYRLAADRILTQSGKTVLLTTGFYVAGGAETDGPPGTLCAAATLASLGFRPVILTDIYCRGLFEPCGMEVIYAPLDASDLFFRELCETIQPAVLLSVERCGRNAEGQYANMRGGDVSSCTAPIDRLFEYAKGRGICTIGIGDGGNEIGMGLLAEVITARLNLKPCMVSTDALLVATTSNWGAYALSAALVREAGAGAMPPWEQIGTFLDGIAARGCVDGLTGIARNWVDGFPPETEREIYECVQSFCAAPPAKDEKIQ